MLKTKRKTRWQDFDKALDLWLSWVDAGCGYLTVQDARAVIARRKAYSAPRTAHMGASGTR